MAARNQLYVGIDLSNPVRMVLASSNPPSIIATRTAQVEFDPSNKASLKKLATELQEFSRKSQGKPLCVAGLPPTDSILFAIGLPALDEKEVVEVIRFELRRMLTDGAQEMRATYEAWPDKLPSLPLARPPSGGRSYVVAAANSRSVAAVRKLARMAGLALVAVETPASAACRASWLARNLSWGTGAPGQSEASSAARAAQKEPYSQLPMDLSLEISIVVNQDVRMYLGFGPYPWAMREIPIYGQEVQEVASVLAGEIVRSVRFARSGPGSVGPGIITLIGQNHDVDALADVLRDRIGFAVEVWTPPGISCPSEYGLAAGLALRMGGFHGFGTAP